jgi:hypothetical protein
MPARGMGGHTVVMDDLVVTRAGTAGADSLKRTYTIVSLRTRSVPLFWSRMVRLVLWRMYACIYVCMNVCVCV